MQLKDKIASLYRLFINEFLKYFIIGITGLAVDMITLAFIKETFDMRPVYAVIINQVIMLNYVFFLNKHWTFRSQGITAQQIFKFMTVVMINYVFSVFWMYLLNEKYGVNYLLSRAVNIAIAVSWNFLLYKFYVFPVRKES